MTCDEATKVRHFVTRQAPASYHILIRLSCVIMMVDYSLEKR